MQSKEPAARGGHVLDAHIWHALEGMVTEESRALRRYTDKETGLSLIRLNGGQVQV